jgi:hypothetical protein
LICSFFVFFGTIQIRQSHPAGALRYSGAPNSPLDRCLFGQRAGLLVSPPPLAARLHELFSLILFYWQIKSPMPCIMLCIMLRSQLASAASAFASRCFFNTPSKALIFVAPFPAGLVSRGAESFGSAGIAC